MKRTYESAPQEVLDALDGQTVCGAGYLDCPYGDENHYHCAKCGGVTGMMGHYAGQDKPFSCEVEK